MSLHHLELNEDTLHGFFSKELRPVLTIQSGDAVRFKTLDAGWYLERPVPDVSKRPPQAQSKIEGPKGHALCGPVYIEGARPGMTLAVKVEALTLGHWGWTYAGRGPFGEIDEALFHVWELDTTQQIGKNQYGHTVALKPFMGVMGMPPPGEGQHSTRPPRIWGGNIDCKELTVGSTLYLPICVEGALFSTGDGHAAQGDGEISGTAIECPMEAAELSFTLLDDMPLTTARADTAAGLISFGFDEDLNIATEIATKDMIAWMQSKFGLARNDALALASVVVDLRVTQIANQVHGVHAVLPHGAWW
jgi:acetamidase/formamidase